LYRAGSLITVAKEIPKYSYKLDLVRVQEFRWDRGDTATAGGYAGFYGKGNENRELDTGFFLQKIIIQYQQLTG
jgi:hypothetical protein